MANPASQSMIFILYSAVSESSIGSNIGLPEYSYYFVLKGFQPLFEQLGEVAIVDSTAEAERIYEQASAEGVPSALVTFCPPNKSVVGLSVPTLTVFAWEFDTLPDESWDGDPAQDWRTVLAEHGKTIVLSEDSRQAVIRSMGENYPVASIPVPVWELFSSQRASISVTEPLKNHTITFHGTLVDSRSYTVTADRFSYENDRNPLNFEPFIGESMALDFSHEGGDAAYLGGFYESEVWGIWSQLSLPWLMIPAVLEGELELTFELAGYGPNADREIAINLAGQSQSVVLPAAFGKVSLNYTVPRGNHLVRFETLDLTPVPGALDARSLGIGLKSLTIKKAGAKTDGENAAISPVPTPSSEPNSLALSGVVYTSVFNPADDRKNWIDLVSAFCFAFKDTPDATLVLKITHRSVKSFLERFHLMLQQMGPFKCRVVAIQGFLDDEAYQALVESSTYYVNASRCEGLCLPLMEFMSLGVPGIAPKHTAMADYVNDSANFIVESSLEPAIWPHDPRALFRALRYRIDWESLVGNYRRSYDIARTDDAKYLAMSREAKHAIESCSSFEAVLPDLKAIIQGEAAAAVKSSAA